MFQRLTLSVLTGFTALAASSGLAHAEVLTHRVRDDQQPIVVKPLDDPANPYREMYRECDHWIYDNAAEPDAHWVTGPGLDDINTGIDTCVDANGFMLPYLESERLWFDFVATGQRTIAPFPYRLYAYGPLSAELAVQMRLERDRLWAAYLPPVPNWLVQLSPQWSVLLPDRRIVAMDVFKPHWEANGFIDPHLPNKAKTGWAEYKSPGWILYSAEGSELSRLDPDHAWYELTFPGFPAIYENYLKMNEFTFAAQKYGYVYIYDGNRQDDAPGAPHSYAWFDYDGTPYPANSMMKDDLMARRNGNAFLGIHGYDLPLIYAAQQEIAAAQAGTEDSESALQPAQ